MPTADELVRTRARELGFDAVGVARADEPLDPDYGRYEAFVDAGMHGEMGWLAEPRTARARLDGDAILTGARSVVCVAESYAGAEPLGGVAPLIARYARGRDYHNHVRKRLRQLAAYVRTLGEGVAARPMVDDAPVLERAWAARAGLGFVGKNGLVIAPGLGSFLLVGEVVTTLALTPDTPIAERCGSCTACLDACPTDAFPAPFVLDARRCVSYLTIELRGAMPEELRDGVGEHLFGCDACQDACPWNRGAAQRGAPKARYGALDRWAHASPEALVELDEARWDELARGSPVHRATREGLARNAVTVLANAGEKRHLPLLERLADAHADPAVREHARWGAAKLRRAGGDRG
jgi:epoxyqueuosine reductase